MVKINQIKISSDIKPQKHMALIRKKICLKFHIDDTQIKSISIYKRSIDARKDEVNYIYSVLVNLQGKIKLPSNDKDISLFEEHVYSFPKTDDVSLNNRPIVIGLGPAGLFCSYMLAKHGLNPIVFERGNCVDSRTQDVQLFWKTGVLNTSSNVQFGEGGAGTFSDGKLNTLVKDKDGKNHEVLRILVENGAPEEILYDNKPHIGTDLLKEVVKNISKFIVSHGGTIYYNSQIDGFEIEENHIKAVFCNNKKYVSDNVVLAIGHSARDTFELINSLNVKMEPKAFAVGFRVMHPQDLIDNNQYGINHAKHLPTASYKVTSNIDRGVYSFCMCPGGYVVNASSEPGKTAVNGMSYHDRGSKVANSAIIVQVTPDDFDGNDALAGVRWQRQLEEKTYLLTNGKIPLQKYGDFKARINDSSNLTNELDFEPACKGEYEYADLSTIMPHVINENFVNGMEYFGRKIKYFNDYNVIMAGIESRTSSPVRINRDSSGYSSVSGLYPCGEGAGYAGGITSAAMDGIYIAERIVLNNSTK